MKALTLFQPWGWAIVAGHKTVENRTWKPPKTAIGTVIAIHAGKTYDAEGEAFLRKHGVEMPTDGAHRIHGALIGTAKLVRAVRHQDCAVFDGELFDADDGDPVRDDPMFFGPWGWVLTEVRPLAEPVYCGGSLGLWSVNPDVLNGAGL